MKTSVLYFLVIVVVCFLLQTINADKEGARVLEKFPRNYNDLELINGRYRLSAYIGAGQYFSVFQGVDTLTGVDVSVKVSSKKWSKQAYDEWKICKIINETSPAIPKCYWHGTFREVWNINVYELVGSTLINPTGSDYTNAVVTVINALEQLHVRSIVHHDIHDKQIARNRTNTSNSQFYLIDYSAARLYRDSHTKVPFVEKYLIPVQEITCRYRTIQLPPCCYKNTVCSPRDDLLALGYLFLHKISSKGNFIPKLPWASLFTNINTKDVKSVKERNKRLIRLMKKANYHPLYSDKYLEKLPTGFQRFFTHLYNTKYGSLPDYNLLRSSWEEATQNTTQIL